MLSASPGFSWAQHNGTERLIPSRGSSPQSAASCDVCVQLSFVDCLSVSPTSTSNRLSWSPTPSLSSHHPYKLPDCDLHSACSYDLASDGLLVSVPLKPTRLRFALSHSTQARRRHALSNPNSQPQLLVFLPFRFSARGSRYTSIINASVVCAQGSAAQIVFSR